MEFNCCIALAFLPPLHTFYIFCFFFWRFALTIVTEGKGQREHSGWYMMEPARRME